MRRTSSEQGGFSRLPNRRLALAAALAALLCVAPHAQTQAQGKIDFDRLCVNLPSLAYNGDAIDLRELAFFETDFAGFDFAKAAQLFTNGTYTRLSLHSLENFGNRSRDLWFGLRVRDFRGTVEPLYLYFSQTNPDAIELWTIRAGRDGPEISYGNSGHAVEPAKRDLFVNTSALRLDLAHDGDTALIWRVRNDGPTLLSMHILNSGQLNERTQAEAMVLMLLIGGLVSLMLFSVFLFNAVRDRTYLYFIAQLACFAMYLFSLHGYANMFVWQHWQAFDKLFNDFALSGGILASLQLLRRFLNTARRDRAVDRFLKYSGLVYLAVVLLMFLDYQAAMAALMGCVVALALLSQVALVRALLRREAGISLATLGWLILSVSGILTGVANAGWQAPSLVIDACLSAEHWGIFASSILFLFALTRQLQLLRREKEQAELKNRLKQDFIANISHEMRTPLNGIIGFAESIAYSDHVGEIKFYNARIISESERLLFQINQLLDLAKIEAGRLTLEKRPFVLAQSLSYLNSAFAERASAKGIELRIGMDTTCPPVLDGDRLRLEQVLRNLVDNAIKFTESGSVSLTVHTYRQNKGMAVLVFDVIDTGIGIAADKLDQIMEDFVQADSSITRRFGGTGLGTSIARRLVEAMDGHIEVKSVQGGGTTFRVYLPFAVGGAAADKAAAPAAPTQPPPGGDGPSGRRVLVVDDLDINRQVLGIHLRQLDVEVVEAESAEQAIALLRSSRFDLVLMDVFMPGMSGHEATKVIRSLPGLESLPIVAVTASAFPQDVDAAFAAGMDEVLLKPVKRDGLLELARRHLKL